MIRFLLISLVLIFTQATHAGTNNELREDAVHSLRFTERVIYSMNQHPGWYVNYNAKICHGLGVVEQSLHGLFKTWKRTKKALVGEYGIELQVKVDAIADAELSGVTRAC